jgi:hypothetical protein
MNEDLKERLMPAIVVFNFTIVGWLLFKTIYPIVMLNKIVTFNQLLPQILIGAGIGLVTGGVTLGVMMLLKK